MKNILKNIQLEKVHIIVEVILAVAVLILFVLFFTNKEQQPNPKNAEQVASTKEVTPAPQPEEPVVTINHSEIIPVAYINMDELLENYKFAQDANKQLARKQEDARAKLASKAQTLQNEMAEWQRKYETNAFLSRERAESEQQKLLKKQQELQELEVKLTEEIMIENQKLVNQLNETLTQFLKEFNADGRYHVILNNNAKDNILWAAETYNITDEVVKQLNARYTK